MPIRYGPPRQRAAIRGVGCMTQLAKSLGEAYQRLAYAPGGRTHRLSDSRIILVQCEAWSTYEKPCELLMQHYTSNGSSAQLETSGGSVVAQNGVDWVAIIRTFVTPQKSARARERMLP